MAGNSLNLCKDQAKDIWIRSRTNAFANEVAVRELKRKNNIWFAIRTAFTVIPIALVSLSLSLNQTYPDLAFWFSIISVGCNTIALFLNFLSTQMKWNEQAFQYKEQLNMFSLIAQKARRIDNDNIAVNDAKVLCEQLQEFFELTKAKGVEPDDKYFTEAKKMIKKLNTFPFDLTSESV